MPLERHFEICRQFGFHWLEFGIGGGKPGRLPSPMTDSAAAEIRRLAATYGLETPFCCLENDFTLADEASHRQMLDRTLDEMRWAVRCGATHVRLFAGFTPLSEISDAIWQRLISAFVRCDGLASELGLRIAIETHGMITPASDGTARHVHTVTTQRDAIRRLLEELPSRIGFNYDPGNLKPLSEGDGRLCLDLLDPKINYCHLKDWRRDGEGWVACAIGDDDLDYAPLLTQMSFDGVYLIEYEPLHDPLEGIQRSLDYLRHLGLRLDLGDSLPD